MELRVDVVDDPIRHLLQGEVEIEGRMPYSSNATFLVHVTHDGASDSAIYKPTRGGARCGSSRACIAARWRPTC